MSPNNYNLDLADFLTIYAPAGLTCVTFFWIAYRYFKQDKRHIGFTLIFILLTSDFTFSAAGLVSAVFPKIALKYVYQTLFYLTIHFSVFWAAIMAYIVYKSLQDREGNIQKFCLKMIVATLAAASLFTVIWDLIHFQLNSEMYTKSFWLVLLTIPLIFCLPFVFTFYWKSVKLLKAQSEFVQKSTSIYVRNLRIYSIVQMLTYGPTIIYFYVMVGYIDFSSSRSILLLDICMFISFMSGFVNCVIFLSQGSMNHSINDMEQLDLDLTKNDSLI